MAFVLLVKKRMGEKGEHGPENRQRKGTRGYLK